MGFASRFAFTVALMSLAAVLPARAQQVEVEVGSSLICDTQQQAERFAALFDGNAEAALRVVNVEHNDPTACAVVSVAFVRGREVGTARSRAGSYRVVRILVLGLLTERGLLAAEPAAYYSIVPLDEREA
jgi:hypothetical protein